MPKHYTNIPPAANNPAWGEPVFPINTPYPGGYPPADAPRLPGIPPTPVAPVKIRTTATADETAAAPPSPAAETAPARGKRSPNKTQTKEPRMVLSKLLFGGGSSRRTPVLEWQKLKSRNNKHTPELYRTAVPGGWLISQSETGGLVFLPDPDHDWDGDSLPTCNNNDE